MDRPASRLLRLFVSCLALAASAAPADTVYKSIGPDGRVLYSDQPPAGRKIEKVYSFADLPASPVPEAVQRYRQGLEAGARQRLANAPHASTGAQLYSAAWCGYCRKAKSYLAARGIPYQEFDIDTPAGAQAFAQAGGSGGIPLLLWKGQRVQGFSSGAYDALLGRGR